MCILANLYGIALGLCKLDGRFSWLSLLCQRYVGKICDGYHWYLVEFFLPDAKEDYLKLILIM